MQTALKGGKMGEEKKVLTAETIRAIEATLSKGERVELIPTRDGVKALRVRREEIKK